MSSTHAAIPAPDRPRLAANDPLHLRRAPLLFAALAFVAGDLLGRHWHAPGTLAAQALLLLLLSGAALRYASRIAWLPVLAFWIAAGCWSAQVQIPVDRQPELRAYGDGLLREVQGEVVSVRTPSPRERIAASPVNPNQPWLLEPGAWENEPGEARLSLDLRVRAIEQVTPDRSSMVPVQGGLRVLLIGPPPAVHCGDQVTLDLRLRLPDVYRDPGAWNASDELLREGVGALASGKASAIEVHPAARWSWPCSVRAVQAWAAARLTRAAEPTAFSRHLPPALQLSREDAAILRAMLLGDRSGLGNTLRAGLERTGTFHLFVVSGLHVAMLAGGVLWLMRRVTSRKPLAFAVTVLCTAAYAMVSGFATATVRSLLMVLLYALGWALLRRGPGDDTSRGLNALGGAVLVILVADPRALFGAGFQMTALVILAVAGLATPITTRTFGPYWRALDRRTLPSIEYDLAIPPPLAHLRVLVRFWGEIAAARFGPRWRAVPATLLRWTFAALELALVNLTIELVMALPMAVYFHRANPLALLANLVVVPLAPVLLASAATLFVASLIHPTVAAIPAVWCAAVMHLSRAVVDHLGRFAAADVRLPGPTALGVTASLVALLAAISLLRSARRHWLLAGGGMMLLIPVAALWPVRPGVHPGVLEVTSIDVGQGDSELVVSPEGRTMLVDGGGPVGRVVPTGRWELGEDVLAPYLWSRHLRRLDVVAVSHGHSDHIGGLPAVLRDLRPRELWLSPEPGEPAALATLIDLARSLGMTVRVFHAGDAFRWGGLEVNVLAPEADYNNPGEPTNDDSLVLRLGFGKGSVLLEGDAEGPSERAMLAHDRLAPVTLLKVAHHGSRTSTSQELLAAVQPREAIISVGARNTFGHPKPEVLARLEAAHVRTYRTDREGAVSFLLHPDGRLEEQDQTSEAFSEAPDDAPQ